MAVAELPRELVVAIARAAKHGGVLTRMLQVCRTWRAALNAEIVSLWRETALSRFPRVHGIVAAWAGSSARASAPPGAAGAQAPCYRALYRNHLHAERRPAPILREPTLNQYILTVEMSMFIADISNTRTVARSSQPLDCALYDTTEVCGSVILTKEEAAYDVMVPRSYSAFEARDEIKNWGVFRFYVTRLSDMKICQIVQTYENGNGVKVNEEGEVCFETLEMTRIPKLFEDTGLDLESAPAMTVKFNPLTMKVTFELYEVAATREHTATPEPAWMTIIEFRKYLAWFAVW